MSDYISKSAFSEALNKSEKQPTRDSEDYIEGYCEGWNDVIDIRNSIPTLDEKEILRKPFERVVERLEEKRQKADSKLYEYHEGKAYAFKEAIKIVKEECGISE